MEEKEVLVTNDLVISKYTPKSWFKSCRGRSNGWWRY